MRTESVSQSRTVVGHLLLLQAPHMAAVTELVRCCGQGIRVSQHHALCLSIRACQKEPEAVDIEQRRFNLVSDAAAHHIKPRSQLEQWIPTGSFFWERIANVCHCVRVTFQLRQGLQL